LTNKKENKVINNKTSSTTMTILNSNKGDTLSKSIESLIKSSPPKLLKFKLIPCPYRW